MTTTPTARAPVTDAEIEHDDETCTSCWGTGYDGNLERRCDCQGPAPVADQVSTAWEVLEAHVQNRREMGQFGMAEQMSEQLDVLRAALAHPPAAEREAHRAVFEAWHDAAGEMRDAAAEAADQSQPPSVARFIRALPLPRPPADIGDFLPDPEREAPGGVVVPDGWRLMPFHPVEEMQAAWSGTPGTAYDWSTFTQRYAAMLAAAPPPPAHIGGDSPSELQNVHEWFSLSYSAYLVMPRLAMSAMPLEWQHQMTALLDQINERFNTPNGYTVTRRDEDGKIMKDPWADYRRGNAALLATPAEGGGT